MSAVGIRKDDGEVVSITDWLADGWSSKAPVPWTDWRRDVANTPGARVVTLSVDEDEHGEDEITLEVHRISEVCKRGRKFTTDRGEKIALTRIVGALATLSDDQVKAFNGQALAATNIIRHDRAWCISPVTSDHGPIYYFSPQHYEQFRPKGLGD